MNSNQPDIRYLFEPESVAIIGASRDKNKIGYKFIENITAGGYRGKIYPVNPEGGEILGCQVYKKIEDIDAPLDVVCFVIPAKYIYDSVKSSADRGAKFGVIIASGFSEVGNKAEEKKIAAYARAHGMRIIGPNVFGIYSAVSSINATFGPSSVRSGHVAVITQSGAIGIGMMGKTVTENIGLSAIISVGNKSDIDESDLLEYLLEQKETNIILMYLEGVSNGERLVTVLKDTTRKKPVIVIKSGRSQKGAMAAASHTSSLAGEDRVFDDIIKQCGVIRSESILDALSWCHFLADTPLPKGENTVIITNGGGMGVMAADACEKYDVRLYDDLPGLTKTFSGLIPSFGSLKNPVDLSGQASAELYDNALMAALNNSSVHSVICLACQTAVFNPDGFRQIVEKRFPEFHRSKPLVLSLFGGAKIEQSLLRFQKSDIPAFEDVYEAVSLLGALYSFQRAKNNLPDEFPECRVDTAAVKEIINQVRADGRTFLLSSESLAVARLAGISTPKSYLARNLDEAVHFAEDIGYPVAMKVVSRDIIHKSDAGGVALDIIDRNEVMDAYAAIMHNARDYRPGAVIEGIEIEETVQTEIETIVGARRDQAFGPIVMFGLGGIYVEVMRDIAFRAFPLGIKEAFKMIGQIRAYPLLLGVRGEKRKDVDTLAGTIIKLGTILKSCQDISDIEINPLAVFEQGKGVRAIDVRILLSKREEAAS
jgi:acetyl coenzyme A synthetase (ADP forming)-like protein